MPIYTDPSGVPSVPVFPRDIVYQSHWPLSLVLASLEGQVDRQAGLEVLELQEDDEFNLFLIPV